MNEVKKAFIEYANANKGAKQNAGTIQKGVEARLKHPTSYKASDFALPEASKPKVGMGIVLFDRIEQGFYFIKGLDVIYKRLNLEELFEEYCRNKQLRNILRNGNYKYIDGYLVTANSDYILSKDKQLVLNNYVYENLDKCVLGLYTQSNNNKLGFVTPSTKADLTFFEEEYTAFRAIKKTYTLGEAIDSIFKVRGIQVVDASLQTGLASSQITRLKSDKHKHTLRLLAQFCAGLGLEPFISHDLIAKAGISLESPTVEDFAYMWIIDTMSGKDIGKINKALSENNIEPFNIAKENQ